MGGFQNGGRPLLALARPSTADAARRTHVVDLAVGGNGLVLAGGGRDCWFDQLATASLKTSDRQGLCR